MPQALGGLEFAEYLRSHWLVIAGSTTVALLLAGTSSVLLPERYTATASVVIEPPAGNDPRGATAVSTVYLESLKTYELFASSDTLFSRALDQLHLRGKHAGTSLESLKRRVLQVSKPASTKILQISATLEDPKEAQALAQYIAEQTVATSKSLERQSSEDITRESQRIWEEARVRLEKAERALDRFTEAQSVATLAAEVENATSLKAEVDQELAKAKAELADNLAQRQALPSGDQSGTQAQWMDIEIAAARARTENLENQDRSLLKLTADKGMLLDQLKHKQESFDAELKQARADAEAARAKLSDIQASAAFRGERLDILDPGIVPQRPSSPNIPLNLAVATLLSLTASVAYLLVRFSYARVRALRTDPVYSLR